MGIIGGTVGYKLLRMIRPPGNAARTESAYHGQSKLEALLGPGIWDELVGKVVIDFGCGQGAEAVEIARRGAQRVIGLDIREKLLQEGRGAAARAGVADRCIFATQTRERADVILSLDAFEHFDDPGDILRSMSRLVKDEGYAIIAFGPTWYHPLGGHLFSVFPWAHLIFTEKALIRWRADFNTDGATRFHEVEGGLNQMTIRRFRKLVIQNGFQFARFEPVPIRKLSWLANPLTEEFFTAIVRCRLMPRKNA